MASMALKHYTGLRRKTLNPHLTLSFHPLAKQKSTKIYQIKANVTSPKVTGRNLRVVVVGGGPTGGSAVETLAKGRIETFRIERKLNNCKPCSGALLLCMFGDFDLPLDIIDHRLLLCTTMASMALKHYTGLRRKTLIPHLTLPFHPLAKQKSTKIYQIKASATSPKVTGRNLRVVVVGGGPTGGSAVVTLTKGRIKTFQIERKLDNCMPCGGALLLYMFGDFDLPLDIIDHRVTNTLKPPGICFKREEFALISILKP
ncbi:hypothetical protein Dimus_021026 [Dionaea muscipula]